MSDDRRKANRPSTGTVPKIKPYNGMAFLTERERSRILTNNLVGLGGHPQESINTINNRRRNPQNNYFTMNTTLEEPAVPLMQNGTVNFNGESISGNSSSTASRRNSSSSVLKCDNITKYPDKKQIEHKLEQIREYLKITNSLMTSMGNTDEQLQTLFHIQTDQSELDSLKKMLNDLIDSERKLVNILEQWDMYEDGTEQVMETVNDRDSVHSGVSSSRKNDSSSTIDSSQEMDILREQQLALLHLQQKAENKLRQARQVQTKLLLPHGSNDFSSDTNIKDFKSFTDFDVAIRELEERSKGLCQSNSFVKAEENIMAKVEDLQEEISQMHNTNDERERLIRTLDNQDAELRSQHAELQSKLSELQSKKMQVDRLVEQLQSFGEEDDEDVGNQVRRICTMKEQLTKLKDMLEIVKTTENIMENTNASEEDQATCMDICTTAENFLDKDVKKRRLPVKCENDTSSEGRTKQVNKNTREQGNRAVKQNSSNFSQKVPHQNELESRKRELEQIMGRHKASTSNLNHDVGADTKSEFSCTSNTFNDAWAPLIPQTQSDSDRFSSDDCQEDYTPIMDNYNVLSLPSQNYSPSNSAKQRRPETHHGSAGPARLSTPDVNASGTNSVSYVREQPRSNSEQDKRSQVQKQLQLIKSVCDSMLEQQAAPSHSNVQQLRNNLTPSPLPSVNVATPFVDAPWLAHAHPNSYHSMLATNTIQMQSFMLNTLNQCCQMLWMQQREITSLKSGLSALQETVSNSGQAAPPVAHLPTPPANLHPPPHSPYRPAAPPKANHVSAAYSLPNLSHYHTPPSNVPPGYLNDAIANRSNHHAVEHANNLLPPPPPPPGQLWGGQALNNQVAPGNRANNYWDNFRSYSRQNLLSTKNIEMLQNLPLDRSNLTNPFAPQPPPKSNSDQATENATPRQQRVRAPQPPDVLNVNHNIAVVDHNLANVGHNLANVDHNLANVDHNLANVDHNLANVDHNLGHNIVNVDHNLVGAVEELNLGARMLDVDMAAVPMVLGSNSTAYNDGASNHSNVSDERARRNEWRDEGGEERTSKSKLFEELRENVYKEVASLISANETRPHFLIQLFRDLQMIGSDSLRLKILQSIQAVVSHSLLSSQNSNTLSQPTPTDQDNPQVPDNVLVPSNIWCRSIKNLQPTRGNDSSDYQSMLKGVMTFLNERDSEVVQSQLLSTLKKALLESGAFKEAVKDTVFQKHFSNILDEVLEQYCGKKVKDIRSHLLQTLNELLCGEIGFIQFIQETDPQNLLSHKVYENPGFPQDPRFEQHKNASNSGQVVGVENNMQNGDLAEADQTRMIEEDEEEEEGAVGGILMQPYQPESHEISQGPCEMDSSCCTEGLDQVPTRLLTKSKSRSTTPSRDRSNSRADPDSF